MKLFSSWCVDRDFGDEDVCAHGRCFDRGLSPLYEYACLFATCECCRSLFGYTGFAEGGNYGVIYREIPDTTRCHDCGGRMKVWIHPDFDMVKFKTPAPYPGNPNFAWHERHMVRKVIPCPTREEMLAAELPVVDKRDNGVIYRFEENAWRPRNFLRAERIVLRDPKRA